MAESAQDNPTTPPSSDFGANEWLVEEMQERFERDPKSVDQEWADYFAGRNGSSNGSSSASGTALVKAPAKAPSNGTSRGSGPTPSRPVPPTAPSRGLASGDEPPAGKAPASNRRPPRRPL